MSALSFQLVKIQIVERKKYADKANSSYKRKSIIAHRRGMILDRNDEVIAHDILEKSIYLDKVQFLSVNEASKSLACKYFREVIGKTEVELAEPCLEPLLTNSIKAAPSWAALKPGTRRALVNRGARKLQENIDVEEIKRRNVAFIVDDYYRPLGVSKKELEECINLKDSRMHVLITKGVEFKGARKLQKLLSEHYIKGFDFQDYVRREYNEPMLATHLTGFADYERKGKAGVEGKLEGFLAGRDGHEVRFLDVRGETIPGDQEVLPPKHGRDVRLTLDMKIQAVVEEELDLAMEKYKCAKGAIVIMDPHTGEVLAMASRPHYNLSNREKVVKNGFNYAIQAANETGSTIKIVATSGAINEGKANMDTIVDCGWGTKVESAYNFTLKEKYGRGKIPLWQVLQKSCNIGAWEFAKMIGRKRFFEYAKDFGYGVRTGIQLVGETKGGARDSGNMRDFASCSYGYVITASPLQIAAAYSVIANGGMYIPPHIIKDIHASNGTVIVDTATSSKHTERKKTVLKKSVATQMLKALVTVTDDKGTGKRARSEGYSVGGKTGTAEKIINGAYQNKAGKERYVTSFAGVCPALEPNFVCVVVLDDPLLKEIWDEKTKKMIPFKRGGGTVAAPVFSKLVKRVAPIRGLQPNFEENKG